MSTSSGLVEVALAAFEKGANVATALASYLASPAAVDAPLLELSRKLPLRGVEVLAAALAAAAELDVLAGRRIARLQQPLGGSRPLAGLFMQIGETLDLAAGEAIATGLLRFTQDSAPLAERALAMAPHLAAALCDRDLAPAGASIGLAPADAVPLPPSISQAASRHAAGHTAIRTGTPAEARAAAALIAGALGMRPLFLPLNPIPGLGPWLTLRRLMPVFAVALATGERCVLPSLRGYDGPIVAVATGDGAVEISGSVVVDWRLPIPSAEERDWCWRRAGFGPVLAPVLAREHRHSAGRISQLARIASDLRARGGDALTPEQLVARAAWSVEREGMPALAVPLDHEAPAEALVTPAALRRQLDALLTRCRMRDGLAANLGAASQARYRPGVRALFTGPPGTGKTLAAAWLAARLSIPIFRVDLAAVTSKYIGETEKNLAQLMSRAEHEEIVLLFDEADSLFARRTDVRDAHDRHANAQTNYLLQRIEEFDGIAILTANSQARIDEAFARRLDAVLEFPRPQAAERRELWLKHLGEGHTLAIKDINTLAATADFTGGDIRNAVLYAAVCARAEERPIGPEDVAAGVRAEYRKLGVQAPLELTAIAS
jgi:hypothetical protein